MPDIDFAGLEEQSRQAFKPHYPDVVRRAGRRRRRARAAGAAVAAGVLAAGGAAVLPGVSGGGTPIVGGPPSPTAMTSPDPNHPDSPSSGPTGHIVAGDLDHLYLTYADCEMGRCTHHLAASADRGRTWTRSSLPGGQQARHFELLGATGRTLALAVIAFPPASEPTPAVGGEQLRTTIWTSTDAGATWRARTAPKMAAFPAGWKPVTFKNSAIFAYDPTTGDVGELTTAVPLKGFGLLQGVPAGAGIWAVGYAGMTQDDGPDGGEGAAMAFVPGPSAGPSSEPTVMYRLLTPSAAVSLDGGRTWEAYPLPEGNGKDPLPLLAPLPRAADGSQTVYAAGWDAADGTLRLSVSADGGASWRPGGSAVTKSQAYGIVAVSASEVVVWAGDRSYVSTDGGQTLRPAADGPVGGAIPGGQVVPGGFVVTVDGEGAGVWLSTDGLEWTFVPQPAVP